MHELLGYVKKKLQDTPEITDVSFKTPLEEGACFYSHLFIKRKSRKLYVIFNGALSSDRETSYLFHRYSWHSMFDGSVLYIADPTLIKHRDLNLAWYSGIKDFDFLNFVVCFILQVQEFLGGDQVITYGSSDGGYTALQVAARMGKQAIAVAINPQTRILAYEPNPVKSFFKTCFDIENIKEYYDYLNSAKFNAIKALKNSNCKVLYVQNIRDVFHYKKHYIPLMSDFNIPEYEWSKVVSDQINKQIKSYLYSHSSGHGAEPKTLVKDIIDMIDFMNKDA